MFIQVPEGSLYIWCYSQGLKHIGLEELLSAVRCAGKDLRPKDIENYWNGWYNSDMYRTNGDSVFSLRHKIVSSSLGYLDMAYSDYPVHPYIEYPEVQNRWVPCNKDNKPMIQWGNGCLTKGDAEAWPNQVYLAENLKGTKIIVIDCDGDHDTQLDFGTIARLSYYRDKTHCLDKPKMIWEYEGYEDVQIDFPASFHLTFTVDRLIPTMHFPWANIDIIGNAKNSLRYLKNKTWNGIDPAPMTNEIWDDIKRYVKNRRLRQDG